MSYLTAAISIGAGATLFVDVWALVRRRALAIPLPNYSLVGRWMANVARGHFEPVPIAHRPAVPHEGVIGWIAHYVIGVTFGGGLLAVTGVAWVERPTLMPALLVGLATVAAPFLLMQPGMGAGIASSRSKNPAAARWQSVITHAVFGAGLYASGLVVSAAS